MGKVFNFLPLDMSLNLISFAMFDSACFLLSGHGPLEFIQISG